MKRFCVLLCVILLARCVGGLVDQKSKAVAVTAEARNPGSGRGAAVLCCIAVEWSFMDDNEPAIAAGETVVFRLAIDGVDQPQFTQTVTVASSRSVVQLRFSTVIPADRFFNHSLLATLIRPTWTNKQGQPTLTHGFQLGGNA